MNSGKLFTIVLPASLLLLAAVAWIAFSGSRFGETEVPSADWQTLEPPVSERIQALRQAVIGGKDSAEDWGRLAQAFHAHNLLEQAAACYAEAEAADPEDHRWPYLRAIAVQSSAPGLAEDLYARAAALAQSNAALYVRWARLLADQHRPDEATAKYREALALDAENPHAQLGLAELELAADHPQAARDLVEQVLAATPAFQQAWQFLAELHTAMGNPTLARRSLAQAKRYSQPLPLQDPLVSAMQAGAVDTGARLRQALRVLDLGRTSEAIELIQGIIDTEPGYAAAYAAMGDAQAAAGQWDRARWALERAMDLGAQPPSTYLRLAEVLERLNQSGRSQDVLNKGAAAHPDHAGLALAAAESQWAAGRSGEAAGLYRRVLELEPEQAIAHHRLAQWMQANGQPEQAIQGWARALDLQPELAEARYALAEAQIAKGLHPEAVATLIEGLELDAADARCNMLLAWELATAPDEALRDGDRAVRLGRDVYESEPGNPRAADIYAAALAEAGQFAAAADIANKAMDLVGYVDQQDYADEIRRRRDAYLRSIPYRQPR